MEVERRAQFERERQEIREDPEWFSMKQAAKLERLKMTQAYVEACGIHAESSAESHVYGCRKSIPSDLNILTENKSSSLAPMIKNTWESGDPTSGMRRVKAVVDSGASSSCAPGSLAPEVVPVPSEGSKRGQTFSAAGEGHKPLVNEGEKVLQAYTDQGQGYPRGGRWLM